MAPSATGVFFFGAFRLGKKTSNRKLAGESDPIRLVAGHVRGVDQHVHHLSTEKRRKKNEKSYECTDVQKGGQ